MARRPTDERIAAINEKIAKKQAEIEALEAQKQKLLHPVNMRTVMAKAKEVGFTPGAMTIHPINGRSSASL